MKVNVPFERTGRSPTENQPVPCCCCSVTTSPGGCGATVPRIANVLLATAHGEADAAILTVFVAGPAAAFAAKLSRTAADRPRDTRRTDPCYCGLQPPSSSRASTRCERLRGCPGLLRGCGSATTHSRRRTRMQLHRIAKLGLRGRRELVLAIESGISLKAAAAAFSVSPATAHRWWHRWRKASEQERRTLSCLHDRSSRPRCSPRMLAGREQARICAVR